MTAEMLNQTAICTIKNLNLQKLSKNATSINHHNMKEENNTG